MEQRNLGILVALIISLLWSGSLTADDYGFVNYEKENKTPAAVSMASSVSVVSAINEAEMVTDLYAYTRRLQDLNTAARIKEYHILNRASNDSSLNCRSKQTCLRLALLLSGLEPTLTDYDRARDLLNAVLDESPGPLLKGYIYSVQDTLNQNERQHAQLQTMHQQIIAEQSQNLKLRDKVETLELELDDLKMKIEALTSIEQSLKNREQEE